MQEYWAGFWDHIEDLRYTLLRSLGVIGIGFVFLFIFYKPILQFLTANSLEQTEKRVTKQRVQRIRVLNQTEDEQIFELPSDARFISSPSSQIEGKNFYRLTPGQALFYEEILHAPLLIMGPLEGFVLVLRVCFWLSLVLTAPLWGWFWLQFILPGLKNSERVILLPFFFYSLLFLSLGITLAYYVTLPVANQYLLFFNRSIGQNAWTLTHYVNYVLLLCLGHAIAAELTLLLFMLVHWRVLSPHWLMKKRRYMIVLAFILGALLTPPDVVTQLFLALPLIGAYEAAIWYAKWLHRANPSLD